MIFASLITESLHSLSANRMRSMLAMLGIVIGVASVIVMMSIGQGSQRSVRKIVESMGSGVLLVTPARPAPGTAGSRSAPELTMDDVSAVQQLVQVHSASALTDAQMLSVNAGSKSAQIMTVGVTPEYFTVRAWAAAQGEVFTDETLQRRPRMAVLGASAAAQLFDDANPLGETIRINDVPFEVAGVLRKKGVSVDGRDQDSIVVIPFEIAQKRVMSRYAPAKLSLIMVKMRSGTSLSRGGQEVMQALRQERKLPPEAEDPASVRDLSELAQGALKTSRVMTLLLGSIASISLLVGGIGIMNIMYMCVTERTREIGIRKAIGARQRDILTQFLIEAALMAFVGGMVGVCAGLAGVWAAGSIFNITTAITAGSITLAAGMAVAVGVFFGYYPARKAARLIPVEALRYQ